MKNIDFISGAVLPPKSLNVEKHYNEKTKELEFNFKFNIQDEAVFIANGFYDKYDELVLVMGLKLFYNGMIYDLEDFFEKCIKKSFFKKYSYDYRAFVFQFNAKSVIDEIKKEQAKSLNFLNLKEIKIKIAYGNLEVELITDRLSGERLQEIKEIVFEENFTTRKGDYFLTEGLELIELKDMKSVQI